jgi:hypothetical protein
MHKKRWVLLGGFLAACSADPSTIDSARSPIEARSCSRESEGAFLGQSWSRRSGTASTRIWQGGRPLGSVLSIRATSGDGTSIEIDSNQDTGSLRVLAIFATRRLELSLDGGSLVVSLDGRRLSLPTGVTDPTRLPAGWANASATALGAETVTVDRRALTVLARLFESMSREDVGRCPASLDGLSSALREYPPSVSMTLARPPEVLQGTRALCVTPVAAALFTCLSLAIAPLLASGPLALGVIFGSLIAIASCVAVYTNAFLACVRASTICPTACGPTNLLGVSDWCCPAGQSCVAPPPGSSIPRCRVASVGVSCGMPTPAGQPVCNVGDTCFQSVRDGRLIGRRCCDTSLGSTICRSDEQHVANFECCESDRFCNNQTGRCCATGSRPSGELCCPFAQISREGICCEPTGSVHPHPTRQDEKVCCAGQPGSARDYCPNAGAGIGTDTSGNRAGCCAAGYRCSSIPSQDQPRQACCPLNVAGTPFARLCADGATCCDGTVDRCEDVFVGIDPSTGQDRFRSACVPQQ